LVRSAPTRHASTSYSIARKDLSELSDEELMDMIRTAASDLGLASVKTIEGDPRPFPLIERT